MVISVDFDGTCVTHEFPIIGKNIGAEIVLKELCNAGHQIICTSMRSSKDKERYGIDTVKEAKDWFNKNGIELYGFNDNPSQHEWSDSRKIYAHAYIDDQFLGVPLTYYKYFGERFFVDWYLIASLLSQDGFITPQQYLEIKDKLMKEYPNIYKKHS